MEQAAKSFRAQAQVACSQCSLVELCLPKGLTPEELYVFEQAIDRRKPLKKSEYLYRAGESMTAFYTVKTGAFKANIDSIDGQENIIGFFMPGELMGLDGLASGQYQCDMIALNDTHVCRLPYHDFEQIADRFPVLREEILSISSANMTTAQKMLMFIGKRPVEERLAMFLISISQRFKTRGLSDSRFELPMSRHDIANYLGMAPETISRQFKKLQDQGMVSIRNRDVTINDGIALRRSITHDSKEIDPTTLY
jgi:CRP/FNR family transcriptional regulator